MSQLIINKNISLKSSLNWISFSFYTFRESVLQFIVLGIFSTMIGLIPFLGAFLGPLFTARFAYVTDTIEQGGSVKFSKLFDQFLANPLVVRLAVLNFALSTIIVIAQYLVDYYLDINNMGNMLNKLTVMLIFLIPYLLLQMAMWLAPIICLFNPDITPKQAMILSFKANAYNILTLLIFGIIAFTLIILAIVPLGLGLLIFIPVLSISSYYIYKDMFHKV